MTTSTKKLLVGALVVPAIALAAACTSGSNDDKAANPTSGGGSNVAPAAAPTAPDAQSADSLTLGRPVARDEAAAEQAKLEPASGAPDAAPASTQKAAVISKGQVSLRSKDIDATRFKLQQLLDALDGTIADEQSDADKKGRTIRQRLVLRVPSARFGKAMDQLSSIEGSTLIGRTRSSKDVTTDVIDNATRVRTQRASLARVQALLAQARTLREVISIEAQLSRRQADLDSLEAQQKYLADQTSLSTIDVYLTTPEKKSSKHGKDHDFFSGLRSGWDHLGSSTNALLTGVGTVLPFAVVVALIGFPVWTLWRRRTPRPVAADA